jgi:hypothetical protein
MKHEMLLKTKKEFQPFRRHPFHHLIKVTPQTKTKDYGITEMPTETKELKYSPPKTLNPYRNRGHVPRNLH